MFRNNFGTISEQIRNDFGRDIANMFDLLVKHPDYTADQIAKEINKTSRTVESYLSKLKKAKIIERKGAKIGGYWKIMKEN